MKLSKEELDIAITTMALSVYLNPIIKQAEEELGEEEFCNRVREKTKEIWTNSTNKKIKNYNIAGKIIKNISFYKGK